MQNFFLGAAGMLDQVTKQRTVRLVPLRPLGRTHEVELSLQRRQRKQIVVDVGYDRQPVVARQPVERTDDIIVEKEAGERIEIVVDQASLASQTEVCEGFLERKRANLDTFGTASNNERCFGVPSVPRTLSRLHAARRYRQECARMRCRSFRGR